MITSTDNAQIVTTNAHNYISTVNWKTSKVCNLHVRNLENVHSVFIYTHYNYAVILLISATLKQNKIQNNEGTVSRIKWSFDQHRCWTTTDLLPSRVSYLWWQPQKPSIWDSMWSACLDRSCKMTKHNPSQYPDVDESLGCFISICYVKDSVKCSFTMLFLSFNHNTKYITAAPINKRQPRRQHFTSWHGTCDKKPWIIMPC